MARNLSLKVPLTRSICSFTLRNQTTNHRAYKITQFNLNLVPIANSPSAHIIFPQKPVLIL
jgi:hypothetical protein